MKIGVSALEACVALSLAFLASMPLAGDVMPGWAAIGDDRMVPVLAAADVNLLPCGSRFGAGPDGWISCGLKAPPKTCEFAGRAMLLHDAGGIRCETIWTVLETGRVYTVSFDVCGKGKATVRAEVITTSWRWLAAKKDICVTETCQRVSIPLTVKRPTSGFYLWLTYVDGSSVMYDDFRLEEGNCSTCCRKETRTFGASVESPGGIWLDDEAMPRLTCHFGGCGWERFLPVEISVRLSGGTVERKTLSCLAERIDIECPFASSRGYYPCEVLVTARDGTVVEKRNVPFVVTSRIATPNPFFGIQSADGIPREALMRLGAGILRRSSKSWRWSEPNGPVDWNREELYETGARSEMKCLETLLGHEVPPWACRNGGRTMADFNSVTSFVAHIVRAGRGKVDWFEVINEPDLVLPGLGLSAAESVDYYCGIVNAVSPIVRRSGIPVGVDVSGVGLPFIEDVLSHVSGKLDFVALHPYAWPRELSEEGRKDCATPETGGFLAGIANGLRIVEPYQTMRVGVGEVGWSLSLDAPFGSIASRRHAAFLARAFLLARSFPKVDGMVWFSLANMPEHGRFDYGIWRPDRGMRPLPAVSAYAECARQLTRASSVRHEDIGADIHLVAWQADRSARFAVWCDGIGADAGPLDLHNGNVDSCVDMYGSPLRRDSVLLSECPVYLSAAKENGDAVHDELRRALEAKAPVRGMLGGEPISLCRSRPFRRSYRTRRDVFPPDPSVEWNGPDDFSAELAISWEDDGLRIHVVVRDDELCAGFEGSAMWRNDCLQIGIDTGDNARRGCGCDSDDWMLGLCVGWTPWAWQAADGRKGARPELPARVTRSEGITNYDVLLPWEQIGIEPRDGVSFGLAIAVRDVDAYGVGTYIALGHGIVDTRDPARFAKVMLKEVMWQ